MAEMKTKISKGMLEELYENIGNSSPRPDLVRFNGVEYKTGSKELSAAIKKWRKDRGVPEPK